MPVLGRTPIRHERTAATGARHTRRTRHVRRLAGLTMAEDTTRLLTVVATKVKPTATTRMDIIRIGKPQTATAFINYRIKYDP